jgi:hypothetical protein
MCIERDRVPTRVSGPFGAHMLCNAHNAPNEREEDRVYALMTRVRNFDATERRCDWCIEDGCASCPHRT